MIKFVLILHLCSFATGEYICSQETIAPHQYNGWEDCILDGYRQSHNVLKTVYPDQIEIEKLAIRFQCKEVEVKVS
jgi:hypothetical protein